MEKGKPRAEDTPKLMLGRKSDEALLVPKELIEKYQPQLGSVPVMMWVNLKWIAQSKPFLGDPIGELSRLMGLDRHTVNDVIGKLCRAGLVEARDGGCLIVHDPPAGQGRAGEAVPAPGPFRTTAGESRDLWDLVATSPWYVEQASTGDEEAPKDERASKDEEVSKDGGLSKKGPGPADVSGPAGAASKDHSKSGEALDPAGQELEAVLDFYHKRVGILGPVQFDKLRFWVEDQGMQGAVVAAAINEMVESGKTRSFNYLEGILRNWYNNDIRSWDDLVRYRASKVISFAEKADKSGASRSFDRPAVPSKQKTGDGYEGWPNAGAYKTVDDELVRKWKEMYPDEHGS